MMRVATVLAAMLLTNRYQAHVRMVACKLVRLVVYCKDTHYNLPVSAQPDPDWSRCPGHCRCTWAGGRRAAECQVENFEKLLV